MGLAHDTEKRGMREDEWRKRDEDRKKRKNGGCKHGVSSFGLYEVNEIENAISKRIFRQVKLINLSHLLTQIRT